MAPVTSADAMYIPLGDHVAANTGLPSPFNTNSVLPVAGSQTCTVPSPLADASFLPSGDQYTVQVFMLWPRYVSVTLPLFASHTSTSLLGSEPARLAVLDAMSLPSGDQETPQTGALARCVSSVLPVAASHTWTVPSWLAVATRVP